MSDLHCIGCGGQLQNEDKNKPFYTPKALNEADTIYCMRCFRMRHYGEVMPSYITRDDYTSMLLSIPEDALVVNVIDLFDIEGSLLPQLHRLTQHNRLVVVANKRDLLPKTVKDQKIKHRLNVILQSYGLNPESIHVISAEKNWGIDALIEVLHESAKDKDIYVVGTANVGKSTLINHMITSVMPSEKNPITTFFAPGTTQAFIQIPFYDVMLYDTPGLIKKNHLFDHLNEKALKLIQPKGEVKPKTYQLEVNQTVFLGGLLRMDFINGLPTSFTFFISEQVTIHRTKLIKADEFYDKHVGTLLQPPTDKEDALALTITQFPLKRDKKMDIVLPGLGFFSVKGTGVIRIHTPKGVEPYYRESLI